MVQAAESSGALPLVFSRLTALLEAKKAAQDLNFCCSLPHLSRNFCLALTLGLLLFAVPMMAELFEGDRCNR